jgi:hypothetical protein
MALSAVPSAPGSATPAAGARAGRRTATARRLALTCTVGSAATVVIALLPIPALSFDNGDPPAWAPVLLAVLHLPQLAGVLALAALGAVQGAAGAGRRRVVLAAAAVAAVGCLALVAGELLFPVDVSASDTAFAAGTSGVALGLVAAGAAVLAGDRWRPMTGWLAVAVGGYVIAVLTPALVAGTGELLALAGWSLLWTALGGALARSAGRRPSS